MVRDYIQAARLRTLPLASACVLTGGALAGATGNVGFIRFIPLFTGCLVTVFLLQVLANFTTDLGDFENGADRAEGSERADRAVASGRITAAQMKRAVLVTAGLAFATGVATVLHAAGDAWITLLKWVGTGLAAIAAAYAYTAGAPATVALATSACLFSSALQVWRASRLDLETSSLWLLPSATMAPQRGGPEPQQPPRPPVRCRHGQADPRGTDGICGARCTTPP